LLLFVTLLLVKTTRPHLAAIARTFLGSWQLVLILSSMTAWVVGLVLLLRAVHLWTTDLLSETTFWFLFSGVLILFRSVDERRHQPDFFRRLVHSTVTAGAIAEFVLNLRPMGLVGELLLFPALFALYGMAAVAEEQ
jgi:peptidoglycan/LPS O-acetylase OafA/YrhL